MTTAIPTKIASSMPDHNRQYPNRAFDGGRRVDLDRFLNQMLADNWTHEPELTFGNAEYWGDSSNSSAQNLLSTQDQIEESGEEASAMASRRPEFEEPGEDH